MNSISKQKKTKHVMLHGNKLNLTFGLATKMRGEIGRIISIDDTNEAMGGTFMQHSYRLT
jgi:hypothetical protein